MKEKIKVAIIDLYNGEANQGMRGIHEILSRYETGNTVNFIITVFDLRRKGEIPDLSHDIYLSTGGPGSPYDGEGQQWENDFFALLDNLQDFNRINDHKKYAFLICHSFQMACRKYGIGNLIQRKSNAFGIFPITLTQEGETDLIFKNLPNPFYSVDSRDWQVIAPDKNQFKVLGASVLALEKERPHIDLERCLMAIRFSKEIVGTQFHPEADPAGMKMYLLKDDKKKSVIANHGKEKYEDMLQSLDDPQRIILTQCLVLPNFLDQAIKNA